MRQPRYVVNRGIPPASPRNTALIVLVRTGGGPPHLPPCWPRIPGRIAGSGSRFTAAVIGPGGARGCLSISISIRRVLIAALPAMLLGLLLLPGLCLARCAWTSRNPRWEAGPVVSQLSRTSVRLSWTKLLQNKDCADKIRVKWWRSIHGPNPGADKYKISKYLDLDTLSFVVEDLTKYVEYSFQVIAVEDGTIVRSIDYNRSPVTKFGTAIDRTQPGARSAGGVEGRGSGPAQSRDASPVQQTSSAPDGNSSEMMSWINNNQMVVIIGCAVLGIIVLVIVIAVVASIRARAMRRAGSP